MGASPPACCRSEGGGGGGLAVEPSARPWVVSGDEDPVLPRAPTRLARPRSACCKKGSPAGKASTHTSGGSEDTTRCGTEQSELAQETEKPELQPLTTPVRQRQEVSDSERLLGGLNSGQERGNPSASPRPGQKQQAFQQRSASATSNLNEFAARLAAIPSERSRTGHNAFQERPSEESSASAPGGSWKKPKAAALSALRYLGLLSSGPPASGEGSLREEFAADLLELALAVCTATAADISVLAATAATQDRKALLQLKEFARRAGLLKRNGLALNGALTLVELAQAFLRGRHAEGKQPPQQNQPYMGRRPSLTCRSSSSLSISSNFPSNMAPKRAVSFEDDSPGVPGPSRAQLQRTLTGGSKSELGGPTATLNRSCSDFSITSFTDFNRRQKSFRLPHAPEAPSFLEFLAVVEKQACIVEEDDGEDVKGCGPSWDHSKPMVMDLRLPCKLTSTPRGAMQHRQMNGDCATVWQSEGGVTYHSACDAVLETDGNEQEIVQAEVVNMGGDGDGTETNRVRIAFRSRCLRTQNEWQRQLLAQQRDLLRIANIKLEAAVQISMADAEIKDQQKELLRGFRKIITREIRADETPQHAALFVVEKRDDRRAEMEELCRILEYPCQAFRHLTTAKSAVQSATIEGGPSRRPSMDSTGSLLEGRPGTEGQDWRSRALASSSGNSKSKSGLSNAEAPARVVLLGSTWLERGLPPQWQEDGVVVVLTSAPEEFEEVGRTLLASGEAEIRERLRDRGINDYLMHPLSLESLKIVVQQAIRRKFGDEYLLLQALGRGASGIVHQAKRLKDGESFALKEINTRRLSRTAKQDVERETQLLQELSWPTVVFVVDAWDSTVDHIRFLLMPLLLGGNLLQRAEAAASGEDSQKIPSGRVAEWYAQTLHGLCYLHWRGVLHRDVKPGNLLLAADQQALQIGDLGSAALLPGPGPHPAKANMVRGMVCTPAYASPEVLLQGTYMSASDIWSVGASFYEVCTLKPLVPSGAPMGEIKEMVKNFVPERMSELRLPMVDLTDLLRQDPLRRPSAAKLASQPTTARRIRTVLAECGALPEEEARKAHFDLFHRVLSESEAAADLPAPAETPKAAGSETRQARRRAASIQRAEAEGSQQSTL